MNPRRVDPQIWTMTFLAFSCQAQEWTSTDQLTSGVKIWFQVMRNLVSYYVLFAFSALFFCVVKNRYLCILFVCEFVSTCLYMLSYKIIFKFEKLGILIEMSNIRAPIFRFGEKLYKYCDI